MYQLCHHADIPSFSFSIARPCLVLVRRSRYRFDRLAHQRPDAAPRERHCFRSDTPARHRDAPLSHEPLCFLYLQILSFGADAKEAVEAEDGTDAILTAVLVWTTIARPSSEKGINPNSTNIARSMELFTLATSCLSVKENSIHYHLQHPILRPGLLFLQWNDVAQQCHIPHTIEKGDLSLPHFRRPYLRAIPGTGQVLPLSPLPVPGKTNKRGGIISELTRSALRSPRVIVVLHS